MRHIYMLCFTGWSCRLTQPPNSYLLISHFLVEPVFSESSEKSQDIMIDVYEGVFKDKPLLLLTWTHLQVYRFLHVEIKSILSDVNASRLPSWIGEVPGNLFSSERQESSVRGLDFGPRWGQSIFIGCCCLNKLMWSDLVSIDFLLLSPAGEGYLRVLNLWGYKIGFFSQKWDFYFLGIYLHDNMNCFNFWH